MTERMYNLVPFGKHQGKKWEEVPTDYLLWCLRERAGGKLNGFLDQVKAVLVEDRHVEIFDPDDLQETMDFSDSPPPQTPLADLEVTPDMVAMVIQAGRQSLARLYLEADSASTVKTDTLKRLNKAADWLDECKEALRRSR